MRTNRKRLNIVFVMFVLCIGEIVYAHDGHKDEDMVIPNLGDLGKVDFSVSCSKEAQNVMNTGVGLLHHMMYAQAEKLFGVWKDKEPDCAMMYWGYATSLFHPLWPDRIKKEALTRGEQAIKKAQSLKSSDREKSYINASAQYYDNWQTLPDNLRIKKWAKAQKAVYQHYPKDIDAVAFYSLSQIVTAPKKDTTFSQHQEAGLLFGKFRKIAPTHPGLIHYTIHAYDSAPLAKLAIEAARDYDKIAPDVPHALHMPSHIFVRLGMWQDVINWNVRSAKAALNYPTNNATSMHYAHAIDYLVYGYLQQGEISSAVKAAGQMEIHHPIQPNFPVAYALTAIPARLALEQKNWHEASQLKVRNPDYIVWDEFPQIEAITYYAKGLGAAMSGDINAAKESEERLNVLYEETLVISPNYWAILVDAQRQVINAWISYQKGHKQQALTQLRRAADIEDSLDKDPVTPGAVLPARELLGDMLLLNENYAEALTAYNENLLINSNRLNSLTGINKVKKHK